MPETEGYTPPEAIEPISPEDQKAAEDSLAAFREEQRQNILDNKKIEHDSGIHRDQADKIDRNTEHLAPGRWTKFKNKLLGRFNENKVNLKIDTETWDREDPKE